MRLLKTKAEIYEEEINFLRAQVAQLQNYVLAVAPVGAQFPAYPGPSMTSDNIRASDPPLDETFRLYTTEEEEDIMYAQEEGLIDEAFAKRLLAAAQADNLEIDTS